MEASQRKSSARKKIYLVNRDFQMRYTGAACVVGLVSTALTAIIILYPLYRFEILRIPRFLPWPILGVMICAAFVNIFLVALMGIIITHKLAGPMYSMVRHFRRIEEGIWHGAMRLRQGDELRYLVRNFNGMLEGLRRTGQRDLDEVATLRQAVESKELTVDERLQLVEEGLAKLENSYRERMKLTETSSREEVEK